MGILSDLIRAPIGQAPSRGRGMGAIGARPDLPMPPKRRRKGGLAGLLQRVKDKRLERPISIGGIGGGNIQPTQSPLQQAFEKIQNSIQPVPVLPGQQGMRFDPITRKMVPAEGPDTPPPGFIPPTIGNTGGIGRDMGIAPPTDDPFLRPRVDAIGNQQPIPQQLLPPPPGFIPPTIGNTGGIGRDMGIAPPAEKSPFAPPLAPLLPNLGGQPLVPGSAEPREQTGLTAADLLELSDEELQRYIPRKNISQGVGSTRRTYDATQSPEDFRTMLQAQIDLKPGDRGFDMLNSLGPRRYNPIDTSPQPTQDKRLGALLDIQGTGGDRPIPRPSIGGAERIPSQDFGFGPGIRPTEMIGPDGQFIGSGGVTPPGARPGAFVPPQQPARTPLSERVDIYGEGKKYDPANLPEGFSYSKGEGIYDMGMPPPGFVYAYGPNGERQAVPSGEPGAAEMRDQGAARDQAYLDFQKTNPGEVFFGGLTPPTPDVGLAQPAPGTDPVTPVVDPVVTPTAQTDPTQTQMPMGAIDPVLLQQQTSEKLTDPLLRSLYFGTQDSPGFYQQLQQAGANLIGSDVPLQQTAGLSPLELLARQKAVAGLGGFEPFLQQNRDLVDQAIAQSRRAEELQDPYYTQAEEIYKDTMGAYDPSMTQQFYNPYEDAVVQKTIQDVMEAGDKQDIASRAREISAGAFGGSRARLGAEERRQDLGEGLAQALGNIRSQGFQSAQATGLGEFARQQAAKRTGAEGLMGIGIGRGSAASQLGSQLAGYGSQIGGIGQTQEQMRAGQRGELSGYGGVGRGIAETGLGRIFEQQVGQQYRPMQTLGQIGSMLPGYQASQTQIDSGYGMPTDPTAAGLGAAFSAYGALAPRQEGQG